MKRCPKCFGSIRRMGHIEKPFYCPECKEWFNNEEVTPKQTNADRFCSSSDEKLAELFAYLTDCVNCPCRDPHDQCDTVDGSCQKQWLDWLKKEN